jgi:hypothetical protein
MEPRRCVISLATETAPFPRALRRLERSIRRVGFRGDIVLWPPGSYPRGCPQHADVPFGFKPFCFAEARQRGYDLVLWLDARCLAIRSLDPIFDQIAGRGWVLFRNRTYALGEWASDLALELLGLSREQALTIPEVNGAAVGLDLTNSVALDFLERWHEIAKDGRAFRGIEQPLRSRAEYLDVKKNRGGKASGDPRVRGHRHDQTVAGILAHRLAMTLTEEGLQTYTPSARGIAPSSRILINREQVPLWRIALDTRLGARAAVREHALE